MAAILKFENAETTASFARKLTDQGVALPIELHEEDYGVVIDAEGQDVFIVDVDNKLPNEQAAAIAEWIVLAVNTCAGFKLTR